MCVYLCISFRELLIFSVRVSPFYSYFCVIHTVILSLTTRSVSGKSSYIYNIAKYLTLLLILIKLFMLVDKFFKFRWSTITTLSSEISFSPVGIIFKGALFFWKCWYFVHLILHYNILYYKIWERKVKTLTRNWRDHCRTGTRKLYRNIKQAGPSLSIRREQMFVNTCQRWRHWLIDKDGHACLNITI